MRSFLIPAVVALLLGAGGSRPALYGQENVERIRNGKQATALVEVGDTTATAFCIDPGGLFVTNAHVVDNEGTSEKTVKLVLNSGEEDQKSLTARVLRKDDEEDLALLKVEGTVKLTALPLGRDDGLIETTEVTAFGYPFGRVLTTKGEAPTVSVNTGRITSLKRANGKLRLLQLDVVLNPGNSGGPVTDQKGRVIGVVQFGLRGAGINFAIAVGRLSKFLNTPTILFEPAAIPPSGRSKSVNLTIDVISSGAPAKDRTVEVVLGDEQSGERRFVAEAKGDGRYTAAVVPMPLKDQGEAGPVDVTIEFEHAQIQARAADVRFKLGAHDVRLGELSELRLGTSPRGTTLDGRPIEGIVSGFNALTLDLGGQNVAVDPTKAIRITMRPRAADSNRIPCAVVVKEGGRVIGELKTNLEFTDGGGASVSSITRGIRPAPNLAEITTRKVPGMISDVIVGGGGRYLFLVFKDIKKLGVFDVNAAAVVKYLSLADSEVFVAAGSDVLLFVYPNQKLVQKWRLGSFEKMSATPLPLRGVIKAIAMGSDSNGPLLVNWSVGSGDLDRAPVSFLDLKNMKPIRDLKLGNMAGAAGTTAAVYATHYSSFRDLVHWRASANGTVFGAWCTSHSPSGLFDLVLQGKAVQMSYEHTTAGSVVPAPDGRVIYTGTGGMYDQQLKSMQRAGAETPFFLPSSDANYYISIDGLSTPAPRRGPRQSNTQPPPKRFCGIHVGGNGSPLLKIGPLEEMDAPEREEWTTNDFTSDKRYHLIPAAELLITIPFSNDRVVARRVDIIESLKKSGVDYLFVASSPPRTALRRETYAYQIEVKSSRGGTKCQLTSGPEGMTVSPTGKVNWKVPAEYEGDDPAVVVISITDASGQETLHTFELRIR